MASMSILDLHEGKNKENLCTWATLAVDIDFLQLLMVLSLFGILLLEAYLRCSSPGYVDPSLTSNPLEASGGSHEGLEHIQLSCDRFCALMVVELCVPVLTQLDHVCDFYFEEFPWAELGYWDLFLMFAIGES
ncbi:hypothetical protein HAX54_050036 [Datura stramonium]|uniref:Uncharacterized protein n=1 Tax=Datura stramonium TaxID=4076 RepID=A0ABS8SWC2_DATST|nr:hypothetical protein [Datura stramonium]